MERPRPSFLSRARYYLGSTPSLLLGLERPARTVGLFLGLLPFPAEAVFRPSGLRLTVRDRLELWVAKETCLDDAYFPRWVRPARDWRFIDVGGGVGDFALSAAKRCPDGVVHVYEPASEAFALLEANLRANGADNVVAHPAAVGSRAGPMTRDTRADREGVETRFVASGGAEPEVVSGVSLESVLDDLPEGVCDFLKVDCEGGEFDLLLRSDPALLSRIDRISLEFHDGVTAHSGRELTVYLEARGFRVWPTPNPVHAHLGHLYAERANLTSPDRPR